MLISNAELAARLSNPENLATRHARNNDLQSRKDARALMPVHEDDGAIIRPLHNGGRRKGDTNLEDELRALIGAEGQLTSLGEVAEKFDISYHHAHELASGKVYTEAGVDNALVKNINKHLEEPHQLAVEKLTETLLSLDSAKIKSIGKARDIAAVANQLASIAKSTSPLKDNDNEDDAKGSARIVIYSPTIKNENHYASVETSLVHND